MYSCKPIFERIMTQVASEIDSFPLQDPPRVCIITTGEDEPSARYVRNKLRDFKKLGIEAEVIRFENAVDIATYLIKVEKQDMKFDGIIVQRPIVVLDATPQEANDMVSEYMPLDRDIDGVCYRSPFTPPSVRGLHLLLHEWSYDPAGKTAVVLGRGDVGRPVAEYLLERNATVVVCHSRTPESERKQLLCHADMVVGAAGLSDPIYPLAYPHGVVIDYGITTGADGKLHGDFVKGREDYLDYQTTVPGGMGLMVRSALLLNIIDAYKVRRGME